MGMNICIFGDSITWGSFDPKNGGWATLLRNYFESKIPTGSIIEVYSLGIPGNDTEDLLERFEVECKARSPDVIIFAIGANDSQYIKSKNSCAVDLNKFQINIKELIKKAQKFANKIIFIGLVKVDESKTTPISWNIDKHYNNKSIFKYNSVIKDICKSNNIHFLEMLDLLTLDDFYDGLHPNSKGHKKMFYRIKDFLIKEIKLK